jgi:hypothetical protein
VAKSKGNAGEIRMGIGEFFYNQAIAELLNNLRGDADSGP